MFKKNTIVACMLIITLLCLCDSVFAMKESYYLDREKKEINENETDYEFCVYDLGKVKNEETEEENEKPVAEASYTVYENLNKKTGEQLDEIKELLRNEAEMNSIHAKFPKKVLSAHTLIILTNLFVDPDYRKSGLGSELFQNGVSFFEQKYSGAVIVWIALPYGEKQTTLEKLCNFYDKNKGNIFFQDETVAYYYLPLQENFLMRYEHKMVSLLDIFYKKNIKQAGCYNISRKKRTFNQFENGTESVSHHHKKYGIFKSSQTYSSIPNQEKKELICMIRAHNSIPWEYSLF